MNSYNVKIEKSKKLIDANLELKKQIQIKIINNYLYYIIILLFI